MSDVGVATLGAQENISGHEPVRVRIDARTLKRNNVDDALQELLTLTGASELNLVGARTVEFDLRSVGFMDLGALCMLILALERLSGVGASPRLLLPDRKSATGNNLWSFLQFWKVFESLSRFVGQAANLLGSEQLALLSMPAKYGHGHRVDDQGVLRETQNVGHYALTSVEHNREDFERFSESHLTSRVLLNSLCLVNGWDRETAHSFVQDQIVEGLVNSFAHSRGSHSYIVMRSDTKNFTLVVADDGRGIPNSVRGMLGAGLVGELEEPRDDARFIDLYTSEEMVERQARVMESMEEVHQEPESDADHIDHATKAGTSSDPQRGGYGLYFLKSSVVEHGGELRVRSGSGCVTYDRCMEATESLDGLPLLPGTVLRIKLPRKSS